MDRLGLHCFERAGAGIPGGPRHSRTALPGEPQHHLDGLRIGEALLADE
jgi:hypothetical protein